MLDELVSLRKDSEFLSYLNDTDLRSLRDELVEVRVDPGETLMAVGEAGDHAYIVIEGRLATLVVREWGEERILEEIGPGDLVGEVELLAGGKRHVQVSALEACRLASLSRDGFVKLFESRPEIWHHLSELAKSRLCRLQLSTQLIRLLGSTGKSDADPLGELEAEVDWLTFETEILSQLEAQVDWLTLKRGETLFRQGDSADAAYVVVTGRLGVAVEAIEQGERLINEINPGEIVGEMALLTDTGRSATVYAVRDTELVRLSRSVFGRIINRYPRSMLAITRSIIDRLRKSSAEVRPASHIACIALMPIEASVPLTEFTRELTTALATQGSIDLLTSGKIDEELGRPGVSQAAENEPANFRLVQWLNEREEAFRHVIYQADQNWSPWTERCARQADQVIFVAEATGESRLRDIEQRLHNLQENNRQRSSLVLLHEPEVNRPEGTARWLKERKVESVYHVRRGNSRDVSRLARILAGNALGLVLSGGGARGWAHLGVLRALEELGIPVDMIGGTSVGATLAHLPAQGLTAAKALEMIRLGSRRRLLDYTLPVASLMAGRTVTRVIEDYCSSLDIEDLWLPCFCVSTNITTARAVVHRRGSLARAVRASLAIPGVYPPVPEGGDLLVDGGVLNNLPIDVMRELNPTGPVIAVDVVPRRGPRARSDYGLALSGWRLALNRINPWQKTVQVPHIAETIMNAMTVGSKSARQQLLRDEYADLYLNIKAPGISMLQFDTVDKAERIGYEQSIEPLRKWIEAEGIVRE